MVVFCYRDYNILGKDLGSGFRAESLRVEGRCKINVKWVQLCVCLNDCTRARFATQPSVSTCVRV